MVQWWKDMYADVYCRDSLLHCDNWQIDLDEHACNRSIATDCNTFWPRWPSSTASYKTLCTQLTNVYVAETSCNQLLLIDSATYVRICTSRCICQMHADVPMLPTCCVSAWVYLAMWVQYARIHGVPFQVGCKSKQTVKAVATIGQSALCTCQSTVTHITCKGGLLKAFSSTIWMRLKVNILQRTHSTTRDEVVAVWSLVMSTWYALPQGFSQ